MEFDNLDFSSQSNDFESVLGTSPALGLQASDILQSNQTENGGDDSSSFSGIGDIGLGFAAPTLVGLSSSSDSQDFSSSDNGGGGLLGGLL